MDYTLKKKLEEECERTLEGVSQAVAGSEEAKAQLEKLAMLHKLRMEEEKIDCVNRDRVSKETCDRMEDRNKKIDNLLKFLANIAAIGIPTAASCFWMRKGMKFEETGSYTGRTPQWVSSFFRLFHN